MSHSGQKEKDQKLKERLERALGGEKDFSGYDINVRVVNDKITLQGIVDTLALGGKVESMAVKKAALEAAAKAMGVAEIRYEIKVEAEEGHLVLEGLVADTEQKRLVELKLHSLLEEYGRDLTAVENKIRLPD